MVSQLIRSNIYAFIRSLNIFDILYAGNNVSNIYLPESARIFISLQTG